MFVVLLRFSNNKDKASQLMEGHKEWYFRRLPNRVGCRSGHRAHLRSPSRSAM